MSCQISCERNIPKFGNKYSGFSYSNVEVEVDCLKGRKAQIQTGLEVRVVREAELALDEGEDVVVVTLAERKLKRMRTLIKDVTPRIPNK